MMIPTAVKTLDCKRANGAFTLDVDGGERIQARAVVVASGAKYRRPSIADLADFEGRGIWYWASPNEARLCAGEEVVLVGGGNSAGQGAVFLSAHAAKVRMMVRGPSLADSMSRYLIDRIGAASNIELMTETEIVAMSGAPNAGLEKVRWRHHRTGAETEAQIRNVFLFIGADPATEWLKGCGVMMDKAGFVITGGRPGEGESRLSSALESSIAGSATSVRDPPSASGAPSAKAPRSWRPSMSFSRILQVPTYSHETFRRNAVIASEAKQSRRT